jgi:hypothetical protein
MNVCTIVECEVCELDVEEEGGVAHCKECWDDMEAHRRDAEKLLRRFLEHHLDGTSPDALFVRQVRESLGDEELS